MKVSQETINEIQKLGMKGALSKWNQGGNSAEFDEAIRRYYGKSHRTAASSGGTAAESGPAPKMTQDSGAAVSSGGTRSTLEPAAAKAAAERRSKKVSEMTIEERVAAGRKALDAKPGLQKGKSLIGNPLDSLAKGAVNAAAAVNKAGVKAARSYGASRRGNQMPETGRESSLTDKQRAALRRLGK